MTRGGKLNVLYHKALSHKGQTILALGNDDVVPHYVRVQLRRATNGKPVWFADPVKCLVLGGERGFSSSQLQRGFLVEIPPKDFVVLQSETELSKVMESRFNFVSQTHLEKRFEKDQAGLTQRAKAITALVD